jgi:hypothetical protein
MIVYRTFFENLRWDPRRNPRKKIKIMFSKELQQPNNNTIFENLQGLPRRNPMKKVT